MASAGTVAVILPGAYYFIRETRKPPIAMFREHGLKMAVATDCNPGTSPLTSLLLTMNMAATLFGMTVEECLAGTTREAARALGLLARDWHARSRKMGRPRYLGHRAAGRTRLPHGLQPAACPHLERRMNTLVLKPGSAVLADWRAVYHGAVPSLDPSSRPRIEAGAAVVARIVAKGDPVYGINTGFGKLASVRIASEDVATLQRNLILSHCCGVGEPLAPDIVRLVMALKLASLGRGASGVRPETVDLIDAMLARGILPVIPEKGSVGASGDLAPLAHMAAAMMGVGEVFFAGERVPAAQALAAAGLRPVVFAAKEGLALINGTQVSTALALAGLFRAHVAANAALITGALSTDAAMGSSAPFHAEIHALRGHRGQIDTAAALRALLTGSEIRDSHLEGDERVQDPYCIRCQPQVDGACLDILRMTREIARDRGQRRDGQPAGVGRRVSGVRRQFPRRARGLRRRPDRARSLRDRCDRAATHCAAGRSGALLRSAGLPRQEAGPELGPDDRRGYVRRVDVGEQADGASGLGRFHADFGQPGGPCLNGLPRRAAAARHDREPGDDHRHRGRDGGPRVDFRAPLKTGTELLKAHAAVRSVVPTLELDRYMAGDLAAAKEVVMSGRLNASVSDEILPGLAQ